MFSTDRHYLLLISSTFLFVQQNSPLQRQNYYSFNFSHFFCSLSITSALTWSSPQCCQKPKHFLVMAAVIPILNRLPNLILSLYTPVRYFKFHLNNVSLFPKYQIYFLFSCYRYPKLRKATRVEQIIQYGSFK